MVALRGAGRLESVMEVGVGITDSVTGSPWMKLGVTQSDARSEAMNQRVTLCYN